MYHRLMGLAAGAMLSVALVAAPAPAQSVGSICKDGSSSVATGRGACSGHGGVDGKATSAAKKAAKKAAEQQKKAAKEAEKAQRDAEKAQREAEKRDRQHDSRVARTGASVTCADGSIGTAGRGACSHHGGVARASAGEVVPAPRTPLPRSLPRSLPPERNPSSRRSEDSDPTGAIALCRDGLYSHAANHRGACSKHGGVSRFLR